MLHFRSTHTGPSELAFFVVVIITCTPVTGSTIALSGPRRASRSSSLSSVMPAYPLDFIHCFLRILLRLCLNYLFVFCVFSFALLCTNASGELMGPYNDDACCAMRCDRSLLRSCLACLWPIATRFFPGAVIRLPRLGSSYSKCARDFDLSAQALRRSNRAYVGPLSV